MPKGSTFANDILKLIFQAVAIASIADNAASSPATTYYIALHTADPGVGGSQSTSEVAYTGYARIAVTRNSSAWTVTANVATNAAVINAPTWTAGSTQVATHMTIGTAQTGAGKILYTSALTASVTIGAGNPTASIAAGAVTFTET